MALRGDTLGRQQVLGRDLDRAGEGKRRQGIVLVARVVAASGVGEERRAFAREHQEAGEARLRDGMKTLRLRRRQLTVLNWGMVLEERESIFFDNKKLAAICGYFLLFFLVFAKF